MVNFFSLVFFQLLSIFLTSPDSLSTSNSVGLSNVDTIQISDTLVTDSSRVSRPAIQEDKDSLVRLQKADKFRLVEINKVAYRKIVGHVRFFHNNTYLYCDSALWNVAENYIDALGHVKIEQQNTELTGDKLKYLPDSDLALFRGQVVQLRDKDNNVLRTNHLDYNTKDSIATFFKGGVMRDKNGRVIESNEGDYLSKINKFVFRDSVEMYDDSLRFITDTLVYHTDSHIANYYSNTQAWRDGNYIRSDGGWYDRDKNIVYFNKNIYMRSKDNEAWANELYFYRNTNEIKLYNNVQAHDTLEKIMMLSDYLYFRNNPRYIELDKNPMIISYEVNDSTGVADSTYLSADHIIYYQKMRKNVDSLLIVSALNRRELSNVDAVKKVREKSKAEKIEQDKEELGANYPPRRMDMKNKKLNKPDKKPISNIDSLAQHNPPAPVDSLAILAKLKADSLIVADSLARMDSLKLAQDTMMIDFIDAYANVKVFRHDAQLICDSLVYTGIDSMARLYGRPVFWNEVKTQITSDSVQLVVENKSLKKALFISNAFIASQELEKYYHQIKSPQMIGYFNNGDLYRFDALGGVNAMFYIAEDSLMTTVNTKEAKIMTAVIKNNAVQTIYYLQNVKSQADPIFKIKESDRTFKGFEWREAERPKTRFDLSPQKVRKTEIYKDTNIDYPKFPKFLRFFEESIK